MTLDLLAKTLLYLHLAITSVHCVILLCEPRDCCAHNIKHFYFECSIIILFCKTGCSSGASMLKSQADYVESISVIQGTVNQAINQSINKSKYNTVNTNQQALMHWY